ncbi:MAG: response regulator transcription factor [Gammaproteobacteria bacterium]|jgi:two-component system OmpR family response regulator|nr:response regulator transcription factor [Gammaproteobacteria bacterium]
MRILLVEDDPDTARHVQRGLAESMHVVDHTDNGNDGLGLALTEHYDVVIVDRMLPGRDGISLIKSLRETNQRLPILILSALGDTDDRVAGLKAGGDDYLAKPFAFSELLARVEALQRRTQQDVVTTTLQVGDLTVDLLSREVRRANQLISLQPREYRLLLYLVQHANQVVTRTMLLETVWDYHFDPQTNVIDVHISRLRSKIDRDFDSPLLHTVRGAGYVISEDR